MTSRRGLLASIVIGLSLFAGCTGKQPAAARPTEAEWCDEHGVAEADCDICKLAALSANQCSDRVPVCGAAQ
jgi:hypothetical protein